MTRNYYLQNNSSPVYIKVDVSTPGIAYTEINKKRSGGSLEQIAKSSNASGKVSKKLINQANLLGSCVLEILTIIDLQTVPQAQWPTCYDSLVITYTMYGGVDGLQSFEFDVDDKKKSATGKTIVVSKAIRLTFIN